MKKLLFLALCSMAAYTYTEAKIFVNNTKRDLDVHFRETKNKTIGIHLASGEIKEVYLSGPVMKVTVRYKDHGHLPFASITEQHFKSHKYPINHMHTFIINPDRTISMFPASSASDALRIKRGKAYESGKPIPSVETHIEHSSHAGKSSNTSSKQLLAQTVHYNHQ